MRCRPGSARSAPTSATPSERSIRAIDTDRLPLRSREQLGQGLRRLRATADQLGTALPEATLQIADGAVSGPTAL